MDPLSGIQTRKSTRAFKPTPVPRETVEKIIQTASKSPSYMNTQPWEVAVVSGKMLPELSQILYKLAEAGTPSSADIPDPNTWLPELEWRFREHSARRFKALGIERENGQQRKELRMLNFKFYGAPCVIFILLDKTLSQWSVFDLGAFTQSICLAAYSFGLGSCIQGSPANYPEAIRDFLGIPKTKSVVLDVAIGYPDDSARINTYQSLRVPLDDFVKWYE